MKINWLQAAKVAWSYNWRFVFALLLCNAVVMGIFLPLTYGFYLLFSETSRIFGAIIYIAILFVFFIILIYIILTENATIFKKLPALAYKDFQITLMRDKERVSAFGKLDGVCIGWSFLWRSCVISIPLSIIIYFILGESNHMLSSAQKMMIHMADFVSETIATIIGFWWTLSKKHTGRYLLIEEKKIKRINELNS